MFLNNPWVKIWTSPKMTIREIVAKNPNHRLVAFCFIYGLAWCLSMAQTLALGHYYSIVALLVASSLIAVPIGYILISITTGFFWLAGKVFGGSSPYESIRTVIAWSNVPTLLSLVIWVLLMIRYGSDIFITSTPDLNSAISIADIAVILQTIAGVWGLVIVVAGMAEVQKFSNWRAFGSLIIASALWLLLTFLAMYLLMLSSQAKLAAVCSFFITI